MSKKKKSNFELMDLLHRISLIVSVLKEKIFCETVLWDSLIRQFFVLKRLLECAMWVLNGCLWLFVVIC